MFAKHLLLALSVPFGLSLSACAFDQDSEMDSEEEIDLGSPGKKTMDGGQGNNGSAPIAGCIDGVVTAMTTYQGWASGYGQKVSGGFQNDFNPSLNNVRCDGRIESDPSYPSSPVTQTVDVLRSMAWIGNYANYGTVEFQPYAHWGTGWFSDNWATTVMPSADKDLLGALYMAKWNTRVVSIYAEADGLDGPATSPTPPADYSLRESMLVYNPDAEGDEPRMLFFRATAFEGACPGYLDWYNARTCHNGECGVTVLPESAVSAYCLTIAGGQVSYATSIADATLCLGSRPVKVSVRPQDVQADILCNNEM